MSRQPNSSNGFTNGDYSQNSTNLYDTPHQNGPIGGGRERRAGGYGGFYNNNTGLSVPQENERETSPAADGFNGSINGDYPWSAPENRRNGNWQDSSRSRERDGPQNGVSLYGSGQAGRQIDGMPQAKLNTSQPKRLPDLSFTIPGIS